MILRPPSSKIFTEQIYDSFTKPNKLHVKPSKQLFLNDERFRMDDEEQFFKMSQNNCYELDSMVSRMNKRAFVKLKPTDLKE